MHCENLFVNDCCDGQAVEAVSESLPELNVIASLALVVEAVDTVDGCALVITAKNEEVFRILNLVGEEEADGLQRLLASINVISKEEIICLWREAAVLEQTEKIIVLAVDVTTDLQAHGQHQQIFIEGARR